MANVCCDDIYFYSDENPEGMQELWDDLEAAIVLCPDPDRCWFGNLFAYKDIATENIMLRGNVEYMEKMNDAILIALSTAWSPLYDAYRVIAEAYGLTFVLKSVEPGEGIFINTDPSGRYFPEKYIVCIHDENMSTPSGTIISKVMNDWDVFESDTELLSAFCKLGYRAATIEELNRVLDDDEICIHQFENPYSCECTAA